MFNNKIGKISYNNNKLRLVINNEYNYDEFNSYVDKLREIYLNINKEFILETDLTEVNIGWNSHNKYKKLIYLFSDNNQIAEKYLKNVTVINCNKILIKILEWIFYFHGMNHPIKFINNKKK